MKKRFPIYFFVILILLAVFVVADTFVINTEADFDAGTRILTQWNSTNSAEMLTTNDSQQELQCNGTNCDAETNFDMTQIKQYLSFNNGTGENNTHILDRTGNGFNGTAMNGSVYNSSSKLGAFAFEFDGVDSYVDTGAYNSIKDTNLFSIGGWFYADDLTGGKVYWSGSFGPNEFYLFAFATGKIRVYRGGAFDETGTSLNTGVWQHVFLVFNASDNVNIYVDGILIESITVGATDSTSQDLNIGNYFDGDLTSFAFDGRIDEFMVWNRSLSSFEVADYVNRTKGVFASEGNWSLFNSTPAIANNITIFSLDGWEQPDGNVEYVKNTISIENRFGGWRLNEVSGNVAEDFSGNGFNGTITNNGNVILNVSGEFNTSFNFTAVNPTQCINVTGLDTSVVVGAGNFTYTAWIKAGSQNPAAGSENYVLSTGNTGSDIFVLAVDTDGDIVVRAREGPTGVVITTLAANIENDGLWHFIAAERHGQVMNVYLDGSSDTAQTTNIDNTLLGGPNFRIGCNQNGENVPFNGTIDEVMAFNKSLTTTEIDNLFNRGRVRSITQISLNSTGVFTNIPGFLDLNTANYDNFSLLGLLTTEDTNFSNGLVNITFDFTPSVVVSTNVSYFGNSFEISNATFSSPTFTVIESINFNTSKLNTSFVGLNSFNLEKLTGALSNDVYILIQVDGVTIVNELVRTLLSTGQPGSTGSMPFLFSVPNGQHEMNISFRRTGNGNIFVSNVDFNVIELVSTADNDGSGTVVEGVLTFNNTVMQSVGIFNITKSFAGQTFFDGKAGLNATGLTNISCSVRNTLTNQSIPPFHRTIESSTEVGSASNNGLLFVDSGTTLISIDCSSSTGETVTNEATVVFVDMQDSAGNIIQSNNATNPNTNLSNPVIYTGLGNKLVGINHTIQNGSAVLVNVQVSFASDTGTQTPLFFVNVSGVPEAQCFSQKERFVSNGLIGNTYMHYLCKNLTVGQTFEFNFYVDVSGGEQISVYEETITVFENTLFNFSEANTPPIVNILAPIIDEVIFGNFSINWSTFDMQGDVYTTNITISNSTNTTIIASDLPNTTSTFLWNTSVWNDGNYNMTVTSCENESVEGLCGSDIHSFSINNLGDSNITNIALSDGLGCNIFETFDLQGSFDCVGSRNCTGNYDFNITDDCTLVSGSLSNSYSINASSSFSTNISIFCVAVQPYNWTFNATNFDGQSLNTSLTDTCVAGGLTPDESSCLLFGVFVNGTVCAVGATEESIMVASIVIGIGLIIVLSFIVGFLSKALLGKFIGYGMALIQIAFMFGLLYARTQNLNLESLMRIDFFIILIMCFAFGIFGLAYLGMKLINPLDKDLDQNPFKKSK